MKKIIIVIAITLLAGSVFAETKTFSHRDVMGYWETERGNYVFIMDSQIQFILKGQENTMLPDSVIMIEALGDSQNTYLGYNVGSKKHMGRIQFMGSESHTMKIVIDMGNRVDKIECTQISMKAK